MKSDRISVIRRRSRVSKRIIAQYFIVMICFIMLLAFGIISGWLVCQLFIWYDTSPLYHFLAFIRDNMLFVVSGIILVGWAVITYFFMARPLKYIDEVVSAAEQLAAPDDKEIVLSAALYDVQNELNLVRTRALNDAAIAREAEKRKNDMIIYLAHDLKTPLTSVIGYLTLLRDEPQISPETRARYTGIALDKAERLEQLINEFFDITRFNFAALTLEQERINLSFMLEQTVSEFYPVLSEKGLSWKTDIMPDVELLCDPDKLERVFDNLVRNAVNYSYPDSEIELVMTADEKNVTISFKNRGRTIPPEKLDKIFEQFFRLDSARSTGTGGAGVGLAIAKEIAALHGGNISAQSGNECTVFTLVLPV